MNLGESIRTLRGEKHLSQNDLADTLGVSRQSVSKWETEGAVPDLDKLVAMSELFGVTLDELVKGAAPQSAADPEIPRPQVAAKDAAPPWASFCCVPAHSSRYCW